MILRDWCDLSAGALAPIYETDCRRWLQMLQWDARPAWHEVEHARVGWGLPGFVALDAGWRIRGLAYYVIEHDRIDVGGIVSDADAATDALLDGIVTVADALDLPVVRTLVLDAAVALQSGLRLRGFAIEPHLYLSRSLAVVEETSPAMHGRFGGRQLGRRNARLVPAIPAESWTTGDLEPAAALLARAYDRHAGRLFAPTGEAGEWVRYVRNLVTHVGCGVLHAPATQVVRDGDALQALAMVSTIAPKVAHLAQLVVDPARRGERIAEALVQQASAVLGSEDYRTMTLMVAAGNPSARAVYDRIGFRHDATFLAATLDVRATRRDRHTQVRATA